MYADAPTSADCGTLPPAPLGTPYRQDTPGTAQSRISSLLPELDLSSSRPSCSITSPLPPAPCGVRPWGLQRVGFSGDVPTPDRKFHVALPAQSEELNASAVNAAAQTAISERRFIAPLPKRTDNLPPLLWGRFLIVLPFPASLLILLEKSTCHFSISRPYPQPHQMVVVVVCGGGGTILIASTLIKARTPE